MSLEAKATKLYEVGFKFQVEAEKKPKRFRPKIEESVQKRPESQSRKMCFHL